ncbi:MAG: hypothetical protein LC799_18965 [Actinobacteria bacterium]|nr:hypothetical protein [Actinomycetota bacterium]
MTSDQQRVNPLGVAVGAALPASGSAREMVNEMVDAGLFDDLMDRVDSGGLCPQPLRVPGRRRGP